MAGQGLKPFFLKKCKLGCKAWHSILFLVLWSLFILLYRHYFSIL
jgi:hypothetical protein